MCTKLKVAAMYVTPGMVIQYRTLQAVKSGRFGFSSASYGNIPNVRKEKLLTTWLKLFSNRAIVDAEGFVEHGITFGKPNKLVKIACLFDLDGNLAVITTDSNPQVAPIHHRMPAIIENESKWFVDAELVLADSDIYQKAI